jgi:hypothetical protein
MEKRGRNGSFSLYNFLPENRKGQGMSISTIILLILGIIVLVVLVLGFTIGWNKLLPFVSTNNVNTIVNQCSVACVQVSSYDFCSKPFELKTDTATIKNVTCNYLSKQQTQYGVAQCSALSCSDIVLVTAASAADLQTKCEGNAGKTVQALIGDTLQGYSCPASE